MGVEVFLTWLVTVNDLDTVFMIDEIWELPKKKIAPGLIDKKDFMILYFAPHCSIVFLKSSRPSLPLKKAPPLISVFSPQRRRGKPPSGAQNRYAIRLAGHQSPRHGCAGWDRQAVMGISLQLYCWKWVHGEGLQVEPTRIAPHCSIALHLSPLEWGIFRKWQHRSMGWPHDQCSSTICNEIY